MFSQKLEKYALDVCVMERGNEVDHKLIQVRTDHDLRSSGADENTEFPDKRFKFLRHDNPAHIRYGGGNVPVSQKVRSLQRDVFQWKRNDSCKGILFQRHEFVKMGIDFLFCELLLETLAHGGDDVMKIMALFCKIVSDIHGTEKVPCSS